MRAHAMRAQHNKMLRKSTIDISPYCRMWFGKKCGLAKFFARCILPMIVAFRWCFFALARPQCIAIQDGVAIDEEVNCHLTS